MSEHDRIYKQPYVYDCIRWITIKTPDNRIPDETVFQSFGGTVYLKIPKHRLSFYNIEYLKKDDEPNQAPAKMLPEKGQHGKYGSFWNPEQQEENEETE